MVVLAYYLLIVIQVNKTAYFNTKIVIMANIVNKGCKII